MPSHPPIVKTPPPLVLTWHTEDDTAAFAARLARLPALRNAFIALHGELGAGKTSFVRHLLRALGVAGPIKSPTYAVLEPHDAPDGLRIAHFDFYRFSDPCEWEEAGFRDVFAAGGLKLAEWPEHAAPLLPTADLTLQLAVGAGEQRTVHLTAGSNVGEQLLQELH